MSAYKRNNKLTSILFTILALSIIFLIAGFYFFNKISISESLNGSRYLQIQSSNTKPYQYLSCSLTIPFNCYFGSVLENSTNLQSPPTNLQTNKPSNLVEKCGDYPSDTQLNIPRGHFTAVNGPAWAPDCKHITYSVYNSGTVAINPDGSSNAVKGGAKEGIFLYNIESKTVTLLVLPTLYLTPVFDSWIDNKTISFTAMVKNYVGRKSYLFDITTNKVTSE